jgi:uncharacterized protein with GYD domain
MPHYMFRASYTQSGVQGVLKEGGSARRAVVEKLVGSMGGRLETAYWAFGSDDFIEIAELPGKCVAAVALNPGSVRRRRRLSLTAEITPLGRKPSNTPGA